MRNLTFTILLLVALVCGISIADHRSALAAENSGSPQTSAPVGAVIAFYLYPDQIKKLAPNWLPADGRLVDDAQSPLSGLKLPDLQGKFVLAGQSSSDVVAGNGNSQEEVNLQTTIHINGTTDEVGNTDLRDLQGQTCCGNPPKFVLDTTVDETSLANHVHNFNASANLNIPVPMPPFRKLIYLVRVR